MPGTHTPHGHRGTEARNLVANFVPPISPFCAQPSYSEEQNACPSLPTRPPRRFAPALPDPARRGHTRVSRVWDQRRHLLACAAGHRPPHRTTEWRRVYYNEYNIPLAKTRARAEGETTRLTLPRHPRARRGYDRLRQGGLARRPRCRANRLCRAALTADPARAARRRSSPPTEEGLDRGGPTPPDGSLAPQPSFPT